MRSVVLRAEGSRVGVLDLAGQRLATAWVAVALAVGIYVFASEIRFGDSPLFLLVLPIALGASYGTVAGTGFGLLAAALACAWWAQSGTPEGLTWAVSRVITCVVVGAALGWLMESRQRLSRQLAHERALSLDLIATASFDGYFRDINPAFSRTLGYSRDELLARPLMELVHPEDRDATLAVIEQQAATGDGLIRFQNRYRCKDGSYRWLEWSSMPDPTSGTMFATARDITERKQLEEQERRYQERLEEEVAQRTRELIEARQETVERLALAAEYRDDETRKHTVRVGETAARIAAALGLSAQVVELIREAALLHDVGKLGVSDAVLLKPGHLTAEEFEQVKQHAEIGAAILSGSMSEVLRIAEHVARNHHEWWDGSGYPSGLKEDEIPLPARIVAVADVFDALTHVRPYKQALAVEVAIDEIRRLSGRAFDPEIVAAFETLDPHELAGVAEPESAHWESAEHARALRQPPETK